MNQNNLGLKELLSVHETFVSPNTCRSVVLDLRSLLLAILWQNLIIAIEILNNY